ncbi:hypothetical protein T492DRAFT_871015, partial [Pavlovales sp. CCMP2436]
MPPPVHAVSKRVMSTFSITRFETASSPPSGITAVAEAPGSGFAPLSPGGSMSDLGERRLSIRSRILAWTCYAAIGYVGLTVTVVGLTLDQLAPMVGLAHAVELRQIFLGRGMGAVTGSLVSGWVCDRFSIKRVVTLLILAEAVLLALVVPSMTTLDSLTAAFFAVGVVGSSLVVCATTSACWAFPGALVGPVMSAASASFGIA